MVTLLLLLTLFYIVQVLSAEVHNKVVEAFEVFDHENNKTVDVREVSFSPLK